MAKRELTAVSYVYKKTESGETVPVPVESLDDKDREKLGEWLTKTLANSANEYLSHHPERIHELIEEGVIFDEKDVKSKKVKITA